MARSLQRARELLSREDLIGFDSSNWAVTAETRKEKAAEIRLSASKVGGKVGTKLGAKVGTKAGLKAGPAHR